MPIEKPIKILVVDDSKSDLLLIQALLSKKYHITIANSSKRAIDFVTHNDFDLIIMDYLLDNIDGLELQKILLKIKPNIKFIILSALSSVNIAVKALKMGAIDYVLKPIEPYILEHTVKGALNYIKYIKFFKDDNENSLSKLKKYKEKYGELESI